MTDELRFLAPVPDSARSDAGRGDASFSVCLPAYQAAPWIGAALDSVAGQTYPAHEIIVCDDGSTDDLDAALAPYADRVKLLRQPNRGAAAARNMAAAEATGDFVAFLDPDDRFAPHRLERLAQLAQVRPDLDILTTDAYIEFDGGVIGRYYTGENRFVVDDQRQGILSANFLFGLLAVRRTALAAVGGFDESFVHVEDWDCWIRLIFAGARAGLVDEPLAYYTLRQGSSTSSRLGLLQGRQASLARARARDDLSDAERHVVQKSLAEATRAAMLEELKEMLVLGAPEVRRRAWEVAASADAGVGGRLKALAAAAFPGAAGSLLRRQRRDAEGDPAAVLAARQ